MKKQPPLSYERIDLSEDELSALSQRIDGSELSDSDKQMILKIFSFVRWLSAFAHTPGNSLKKLRRLMGLVVPKKKKSTPDDPPPEDDPPSGGCFPETSSSADKKKNSSTSDSQEAPSLPKGGRKPGQGRNSSNDFTGATVVEIEVEGLQSGDLCPENCGFRVYPDRERTLIVVHSQAPFGATKYVQKTLRCRACNLLFKGKLPKTLLNRQRYLSSTIADLCLYRYAYGVPWLRLEKLQQAFGIPLPDAVQWELCREMAMACFPVYAELIFQLANRQVIHYDDASTRIIELTIENKGRDPQKERTGIHCSGFLSKDPDPIALFFSGREHAGERLRDLLELRIEELSELILMSDAASKNMSKLTALQKQTLSHALCLAHWRLQLEDHSPQFPFECQWFLGRISLIYQWERDCEEAGLSSKQRLEVHKNHSKRLFQEMEQKIDDLLNTKVEPRSAFATALKYGKKHIKGLSLFTSIEKAPLDNNIQERAFSFLSRHRRNSMHYQNLKGSMVGDILMSFIHTSQHNEIDPRKYLAWIHENQGEALQNPENYLPWKFIESFKKARTIT